MNTKILSLVFCSAGAVLTAFNLGAMFGAPARAMQAAPQSETASGSPTRVATSGAGQSEAPSVARSIKAYGAAEVRAQPDYATLRVTIRTSENNAEKAQRWLQQQSQQVVAVAKANGVDMKDVLASDYSVYNGDRWWYCCDGRSHAENSMYINVRNLPKLDEIVRELSKVTDTSVANVEFKSGRLRELRDMARTNAVKAAMEKARLMATAGGADTGMVISISEEPAEPNHPYWWSSSGNNVMQNSVQAAPGAPAGGEIDVNSFGTGNITVNARVEVTLALR